MSDTTAPTYMFVYGTLKNGEANFERWMGPFMADRPANIEAAKEIPADKCSCGLKFKGPALTVHRYPFAIYDYPGVYNAPFDAIVPAPADEEGLRLLNTIADVSPSTVFHATPQRVLGEVFEIVPCALHSAAEQQQSIETSRVIERLDILEDTATGLYSRVPIKAEVATSSSSSEIVTANIYFRTNCFPREELIDLLLSAANNNGSDGEAKVTREAADAIAPHLLSDATTSEDCLAEGRVAAPKLRGFLRTYRGGDHHKKTASE